MRDKNMKNKVDAVTVEIIGNLLLYKNKRLKVK